MNAIADRAAFSLNGFVMFLILIALAAASAWLAVASIGSVMKPVNIATCALGTILTLVSIVCLFGLTVVQPNQARVLTFFGRYAGTLDVDGFHWVNPLTAKRVVSLRAQNFQSERLKVNDARGNPIEIAAVVVWRVRDAANAAFAVEDYMAFVNIQSETAVRTLASHFSYDTRDEGDLSLRGSPDAVSKMLEQEVQSRLEVAGLKVVEARISHLAYAPEIAQTMLRRQQAEAVIAARQMLVEGAVGMVEMALKRLAEGGVVTLDEERKAAMVNNLMVSLVSEQATQPVINTGTMYA